MADPVEVIAEALARHRRCRGEEGETWAQHQAAAVMAAIRAMDPETMGELIGGGTERYCLPGGCTGDGCNQVRAVGPWVEDR